ncbi:MAG: hypothetical protein D6731_15195 [Planctomycetota bacterium]|nr:MAG: hypothetical protein D6731_15195 [Planctomycetota bacterium]
MTRRLLSLAPLALVATTTGCPLIGIVADGIGQAFADDPPRVQAVWAARARAVVSPATPTDEELEPVAAYGPEDDRDTNELEDLDGDDELGVVRVELGPGRYLLTERVRLHDAEEVHLVGAGPHRTRLELRNEERRTLWLRGAKRVVLRGLTVAGYSGGGFYLEGCGDVVCEDVHFAGVDRGLWLIGSQATVRRCVFAGCAAGLFLRGGETRIRESAFVDCYQGIAGEGELDCSESAFVGGHTAVAARLTRRSRFVGNLVYGEKQELGWSGRPREAHDNLVHRLHTQTLDPRSNVILRDLHAFPEACRLPGRMQVPAVHFALLRAQHRGDADPSRALDDAAFDGAERYARAAERAARAGELEAARAVVRQALAYWGKRPLADAPDALVRLAALVDDRPLK